MSFPHGCRPAIPTVPAACSAHRHRHRHRAAAPVCAALAEDGAAMAEGTALVSLQLRTTYGKLERAPSDPAYPAVTDRQTAVVF